MAQPPQRAKAAMPYSEGEEVLDKVGIIGCSSDLAVVAFRKCSSNPKLSSLEAETTCALRWAAALK